MSGTATKGPISGGTVKVFEIISSSTTNPRAAIPRLGSTVLAQGTTAADGSYQITLPLGGTKGGLLVQVTGGSYLDEATGGTRNVSDQFGPNGLRAIFGNISGAARRSGQLSGSVTPFTEMAYQASGGSLTDAAIDDSNRKVASAFGLPDIIKTRALDPNKPFPSGSSADERKYALALASLSQYQKDYSGGKSMSEIETELETQISGGSLSALTDSQFRSSSNNYASSSSNPNPILDTPGENPSAPAQILVTPAATALAIGNSTSIQALVKKSDGNPVPDGTQVSFSTNIGVLSAASAGTVSGLVSVNLSSASAGSGSVTVRSGAASASSVAISFSDPNAPAGLTVSAAASQGVTNGTPILISASVVRAAGGPVANGTAVNFAVSSGSGTLSGATATSNGIATVNLSSSTAGSVTVTASVGGLNQSVSVSFISPPSQPSRAIVKVRTTGTLPAGTLIGGVSATVTYAGGKGLSISADANHIAVSGAGSGSTMIPNTNTLGQVVLGLINVSGIAAGEFATLNFDIAAGNFPSAADFAVLGSGSVIDTSTQNIPGMGIGIASVTFQ